jgi:hypothetical protein
LSQLKLVNNDRLKRQEFAKIENNMKIRKLDILLLGAFIYNNAEDWRKTEIV